MCFDNFLTAMSLLKGHGEKDVKTTNTASNTVLLKIDVSRQKKLKY